MATLQFHDVRRPQPLSWSPIMFPTRPVNRPTIGPNANPKNVTIANAGRIDTDSVPGMRKLSGAVTAYRAAPIAA
jgi:hypothetical protein